MKECSRFKIGKCADESNPQPSENFAKDRKRPDGLTAQCKACQKKYREDNREAVNARIKKWQDANVERRRENRKKHMHKYVARMRRWREKNRLMSLYGITNEQ